MTDTLASNTFSNKNYKIKPPMKLSKANMKKEPTSNDLISPEFNAVWEAIKKWDLGREEGLGYAHATGTDVMIILSALEMLNKKEKINDDILLAHEEAGRLYRENKGIK